MERPRDENDVPRVAHLIRRGTEAQSKGRREALAPISSQQLSVPRENVDETDSEATREHVKRILTKRKHCDGHDKPFKRFCGMFRQVPLLKDVPHDDLTSEDDDIMAVSEYADEIFHLFYKRQERYVVDPAYLHRHSELEWAHRRVLVDWLTDVHFQFVLLPETLYLAINTIDRYLDAVPDPVPLGELQLVGIASLFVATKMEEVYVPSVKSYAYVANFQEPDVCRMERSIVKTLNFDFGYVNPLNFIRRVSIADDFNLRSRTVAKFLLELSLYDKTLTCYRPSEIAAAAMYLSRRILLDDPGWDNNFVFYSGGATARAIEPIAKVMIDALGWDFTKLPSFYRKYATKRHLKASVLCTNWYAKHHSESRVSSYETSPIMSPVGG